jgi:hypothetical protein
MMMLIIQSSPTPVSPSTFGLNISSAPCSHAPSIVVRDQVLHPYKATDEIIAVYILILMFLDRRQTKF